MSGSQGGRPLSVCMSLLLLPVAFACQPFNPWLCKWHADPPCASAFCQESFHFVPLASMGGSSPQELHTFSARRRHGGTVGPARGHCTAPAPCQAGTSSWDQRVVGRRPQRSLTSHLSRGVCWQSPLVNGFCPPNSQPGKLYACEKEQVNLIDLVKDRI